jgi:hypothetical protein
LHTETAWLHVKNVKQTSGITLKVLLSIDLAASHFRNFVLISKQSEVLTKSDKIRVIKPTVMGGQVAHMGIRNPEHVLIEKPEMKDYKHKSGGY